MSITLGISKNYQFIVSEFDIEMKPMLYQMKSIYDLDSVQKNNVQQVYLSIFDKNISSTNMSMSDLSFLESFQMIEYSKLYYSEKEACFYRNYLFERVDTKHGELEYLNLMKTIVNKCDNIREDRTNVGTYSIFGPQMEFDISESIPILTTKFLPWKMVLKELLWFLKGDTNSKHLEEQGVGIWRGNTTRNFLDARGLYNYPEGDVGPMYGYNWRHWGCKYEDCMTDYTEKGFDQLSELIENIKKDPYSRRHLLTTYNPAEVKNSVLAPCHGLTTMFYVEEGGFLSCKVVCRSSDVFLGLPFNIASYAMFTYIIAMKCDLKPKKLIVTMGDTHIYANHIDQVKDQLIRTPFPFPKFIVCESIKNKSWEELSIDDFDMMGYLHHPTIRAPMAV